MFSPDQETVNAFTLDVPEHQYLELNLFAKMSIVSFPHISDIF